ncbi:hypothetical protein Vretimale_12005, partial [Volvox reticuliferus]
GLPCVFSCLFICPFVLSRLLDTDAANPQQGGKNNNNNIIHDNNNDDGVVDNAQVRQLIQHQNFAAMSAPGTSRQTAHGIRSSSNIGTLHVRSPYNSQPPGRARWAPKSTALKFLADTTPEIKPVLEQLTGAVYMTDLFYAACDAGGRCVNLHLQVLQHYYTNNRHSAVNPTRT